MKRSDLILAAAVLAVAALILAFQFFRQGSGKHLVEISVDGDIFGTYDLTEDQLGELLTFANAAAAIVTTKKGAIRSMPEREEVEALIRK